MPYSKTSLGNIDLNLLYALVTLVEERSTVHAATRMHLAQSTTAGILKKLRGVFEDDLLVRNGRRLEPTTRALELVNAIKPHIDALSAAIGATLEFNPETDHREFHLGCTDGVAYALLPDLTKCLRKMAPGCELIVHIGDYRTLPEMLASGKITIALGYIRDNLSATTKAKNLLNSDWLVLRDANQPSVKDLNDFCQRSHAIVTPSGNLNGVVDEKLNETGHQRHIAVGVSQFSLLLATLAGNDLVATVPEFIANSLVKFGPLAIDPCPVKLPLITNKLAWVSTTHGDPSQIWLRDQITSIFRNSTS